jgi:uncharacterized protein (TIRG00374 family)
VKRLLFTALSLLLGGFLLWLLFRSTDWSAIGDAMRRIDWAWLAAAQVMLFLSYPARVQRFTYIVRATDPVSYRALFSATQIGFLANFTLPGRAGEVIRALALSRISQIRFSKTVAFVALDRVTDLIGLIAVIAVSVLAFRPQQDVVIPADTFGTSGAIIFGADEIRIGAIGTGVVLVLVLSMLTLLYFQRERVLGVVDALLGRVSRRLADAATRVLGVFAEGLAVFDSPGDMLRAIGWSFVTWGLGMLSMTWVIESFGIVYPWYTPFVVQAILVVFIAAPNTPGFIGQFHVPLVLGLLLTVPDVGTHTAKAFAIVYHAIQLPPVFILGIACLLGERMNLFQLRSEGETLAREPNRA